MNKILETLFNYSSFMKLAAEFRENRNMPKKCKNDLTIGERQ